MFLNATQEQVRDMARAFSDEVIRPVVDSLDRDERFPSEIYDEMAKLGLFGICVPEHLGGPGFDTLTYAVVMEELARGYSSVADQCGLVELISTLLVRHGTEEQQKLLPDFLGMKAKVAYCITEPEAGTDVSGIVTTAERDGAGWRLNGGKIWIHNAPIADYGFVLARTNKEAGNRGMSIFIVDLHAAGVTRGPKEHKMGQRASQVGALNFADVRLPSSALLGEENRGFHMMMSVLDKGRVGLTREISTKQLCIGVPEQVQHDAGFRCSRDHGGATILDALCFLLNEIEQGPGPTYSAEPATLNLLTTEQFVAHPCLLRTRPVLPGCVPAPCAWRDRYALGY